MPQNTSMPKNIQPSQQSPWTLRFAGGVLLGAGLVFALGVMVGNGKLQFGPGGALFGGSSQNTATADKTKLPEDLDYRPVEEIYDALKQNYDGELDAAKLMDGIKQGLAQATGDPYTEYFNKQAAQEFNEDLQGTFTGIGAELGKEENSLTIVSPIPGFPAEKAGLRPRDIIIEINGEPAYDLTVTEAVKKIRGEKGTQVTLKILRGETEQLTFEITREQITIPSVEHKMLDGNLGYLRITRYAEDTTKLAREAAAAFKAAGVKGVILDVRGNPGGLLDTAVDVSSLWLDRDKIVLEERRAGATVETFKATGNNILAGVPTVVLINEGSASASEITAGALKDNNVAKLVGEKSYGKGSVQQLQELGGGSLLGGSSDRGMLKVTIARWFTPAGKNIDQEGISPDETVTPSEDDIQAGRDVQLQKAQELLR